MLFYWKMDKQKVVYSHNGIQLSNNKNHTKNMAESQMHYAKQRSTTQSATYCCDSF